MAGIVECCLRQYLPAGEHALCLRTLRGLSQVKRLETTLLSLSKSEKADLSSLIGSMQTHGGWDAKQAATMESVGKALVCRG